MDLPIQEMDHVVVLVEEEDIMVVTLLNQMDQQLIKKVQVEVQDMLVES